MWHLLAWLPMLLVVVFRMPVLLRARAWARRTLLLGRLSKSQYFRRLSFILLLGGLLQLPHTSQEMGISLVCLFGLLLVDVHMWPFALLTVWLGSVVDVPGAGLPVWVSVVVFLVLVRVLLRYVFVPLGWVRTAYWFAHYLLDPFTMNRRAAALLVGLQAWKCSARRPQDLEYLQTCLAQETHISATHLLVAGLLQAARGHTDNVRRWLHSVMLVRPRFVEPGARRLAALWLCGEAASRGAWDEVHQASQGVTGSASVALYREASAGLLNRSRPRPWYLALLSYAALPGLRPLLRLRETPYRPDAAVPALPPLSETAGPLAVALLHHVDLMGHLHRVDDLLVLGRQWDDAQADLEPLLAEAGEAERSELQSQWRATVATELGRLLRTSGVSMYELGPCDGLLAVAKQRAREDVLSELEERHEAILRRKDEKRALSAVDEWDEWTQARLLYERAIEQLGREIMPLVWSRWHTHFCNYAVWLFNDRKEKLIAHHIFAWLLEEARHMKDDKAIKLETKNVKVTLA